MGILGFNFGMQGMQFTATSTVAENQTLSFPMYVHSIPNNNDNQDIVSMGCNAALMTKKVIDNSFEVLAIQLMTILQAIDYLECADRLSPHRGRFMIKPGRFSQNSFMISPNTRNWPGLRISWKVRITLMLLRDEMCISNRRLKRDWQGNLHKTGRYGLLCADKL